MASVEHCLYCFEVLAAKLESRTPMTLYQVEVNWTDYPKGLEEEDDDSDSESPPSGSNLPSSSSSTSSRPKLTTPTINRLAVPRSSTSSSSTTSTTSTSTTSLAATTPNPATPSSSAASTPPPSPFTPIGIGRKTSQRSANITVSPLFVTWNKLSSPTSSTRSLRGCIGTFESQPLSSGLASYALTSALGDTRFTPVDLAELPRLEVAVTLLTDFENCSDPMDWEIGVHGLRISFYHHHKRFGATYLPDVAVEQGWGKEECLVSLMRKAGWVGKRDRWREVAELKVVRYQGKAETADWEEYRRFREWVDGKKAGKLV